MSGTWFALTQISNETLVRLLLETLLSPIVDSHTDDELESMIDEILVLYPDDPALGTPFGTGSGTFDLSTTASRVSTIFDHGVDVQHLFHNLTNAAPEPSMLSSEQVMEYWLSFVTMNSKNRLGVDHSQCPARTRWAVFGKLIMMMKVATY
ncbi:hypothetical protein EV121DRAFT_296433 [Schizophyllum commune]